MGFEAHSIVNYLCTRTGLVKEICGISWLIIIKNKRKTFKKQGEKFFTIHLSAIEVMIPTTVWPKIRVCTLPHLLII